MGKIKELLEKKKQGTITEDEQKELDELLAEAKGNGDEDTETPEDEEQTVEDLADKFVDSFNKTVDSKLESKFDKLLEVLKEDRSPKVTKEAKFIVDPQLGKKTVEELADIKVKIPGREGKEVQELSKKSLHFISALAQGDVQKLQVLVEGTGARGGFLVPDDFANMIVEDRRDQAVMRNIATVMTTTSDTLHLPSLASRPKATFRAEAAVKSTSTVDFGETVFTPYSLAVIVALSNELVADAQLGVNGNIVNYVSGVMATSIREREERAFWEGNGTAQPTGVDNYTLRTVAAGAGASDATRADTILAAWARTPQGYRNRATWVMNAQSIENVIQLKDSQGNFLLRRLADAPQFTLVGRPVYEQNDLPGGTAFFGDFSYYTIVDREGLEVRVSDEATVASVSAFERNLTYVRVEARVDGELTLTDAVTEVTGLGTP